MVKNFLQIFPLWLLWLKAVLSADNRTFPSNFKFGVATASYQIEGGWDADGKGENIWDRLCHTRPDLIDNGDNGDISCDSYHKHKEDLEELKELGVQVYRFSLSWSRILPKGLAGTSVNPAGIKYYRDLLKGLLDAGITPLVTIFHWDTPQPLQDIGGWPNPELEFHYAYYARTVFEQFGDLVQYWMTFNEPLQICWQGYGVGWMAPAVTAAGLADYKCGHTVIKSHARAYRIYQDEFQHYQRGRVGLVADTTWFEPASGSQADKAASERALQFTYGWFLNPIVHGNYPEVMIDRIDSRSTKQGYTISRLPKFTEEEIAYIKGTHDFLCVNAYTSTYVKAAEEANISDISYDADKNVDTFRDNDWTGSAVTPWLKVVPWGLRKLVKWVSDTYNHPEILVTENGFSDNGELQDEGRIEFYREYLSSLLEAILDDGVNVTHYTAWSLMDNFTWGSGYSERYGFYWVNFTDPNRSRIAKASASYFKKIMKTRCLVDKCVGGM